MRLAVPNRLDGVSDSARHAPAAHVQHPQDGYPRRHQGLRAHPACIASGMLLSLSFTSSYSAVACSPRLRKPLAMADPLTAPSSTEPAWPGPLFTSAPSSASNWEGGFEEMQNSHELAQFLEPPPGLSPERPLSHPSSSRSTSTGRPLTAITFGTVFERFTTSLKLPPITRHRHRPRLDSLAPINTQWLTTTMTQKNHSNDEIQQDHLTRHSPPFQPNERQPSNVGLPSFSQVRHPRSDCGRH